MRQNHKILQHLRHAVTVCFVAAIFVLPIYTTGSWIYGVVRDSDSRQVMTLQNPMVVRPADKEHQGEIRPFDEPIVTITFDDGWESAYSIGLPVMQQYGITSTQYILAGEFDNMTHLSETQVKSFQKYGHEIASHTISHPNLTTLNAEQLYQEVVESKKMLEAKFGTIRDFASPLGAHNDTTTNLVRQHYRSQRNTAADPQTVGDEDVNTRENFQRYDIIAYTVRRDTTVNDINRLVDYAIKRKAWVVLTYHQLVDDGSEFAVTQSDFESQMKALFKKPIRSVPMGAVLDAIAAEKRSKP